ncbi:MAG TPA: ABC transporter ATP-binding protein, partial [Thermoanaerobaculia bacterium]
MSAPAVVLHDLERRFGDFIAVNRISLEVARGEIFGFLGPNGAGKSTTIRMLTGIIAPTAGEGTVAGFDINTEAEKIKANIGYMSQKFSLYEDLTVEENLDFYGGIYGLDATKREERKRWVLAMAGLENHRKTRTGLLPAGWKQRLSLGAAILHEPPIVFLDEPTSGVDPISRRRFWELIDALSAEGVTVFVTTHYMEEAEYCHRLGLVYRGELVALGTPEELKREYMEGTVIAIATEAPNDAIAALEGHGSIRELALFGAGVHAVADAPEPARTAIEATLREKGIPVEAVEAVKPSLEDVFVSLIEQRDR